MPAERLTAEDAAQWERKTRTEREFQEYARAKVDAFMEAAGLTTLEHDVYWLRVGYLQTWRSIGYTLLGARTPQERDAAAQQVLAAFRRAHKKLVRHVVRTAMWWSPLHPSYAYWRAGQFLAETRNTSEAQG